MDAAMSLPRLCLALLVTIVSLTAAQPPNIVFIFADDRLEDVIESAEECPGECIFIEP